MSVNKYFEEFGKPFDVSDISWKIQNYSKDKTRGLAVAFLDARAVADRLDKVVGQNRWKNEYTPWHDYVDKHGTKFAQLCTIYIYDDELGEWIGKSDGAEDSDIEPVKGGISDSFKRAAVKWNIGRYLYQMEAQWVDVVENYGRYEISKESQAKLTKVYCDFVSKTFGVQMEAPKEQPPKPQPQQNPEPKQQKPVYEIKNLRVENGQKGEYIRMLLYSGGRSHQAVACKDERLKVGTKINIAKSEMGKNQYGECMLLKEYELAA